MLWREGFMEDGNGCTVVQAEKTSSRSLGGHNDDTRGKVRPLALDASKQLLAVNTRHPKITHDDVIALSSKSFEGLLSVCRSLDVVAILAEQDGERLPEVCGVFYQQDAIGHPARLPYACRGVAELTSAGAKEMPTRRIG